MATYTKETALYDTGAIANDIGEAGETASKYITAVDQSGIKVHAENNINANYTLINAEGMEVFQGDTAADSVSVAKFGVITRIGDNVSANISIDEDSITGVGEDGKSFFKFADSDAVLTTKMSSYPYSGKGQNFPVIGSAGISCTLANTPDADSIIDVDFTLRNSNGSVVHAHLSFTQGVADTKSQSVTYRTSTYTLYATYDGSVSFTKIYSNAQMTDVYSVGCRIIYESSSSSLAPSFEIGEDVSATGGYSYAEGQGTTASGNYSHAEGRGTTASGINSHAENRDTTASGVSSHAEGASTTASGSYSHAEGNGSQAIGHYCHAEGNGTKAGFLNDNVQRNGAHAEGIVTTASGEASHAEGFFTTASNSKSHAEGDHTTASGEASHTEGCYTTASNSYSHAEGYYCSVGALASHAEGWHTTTNGSYAHAEGYYREASGTYSHASGNYVIASGRCQTAIGKFNVADTTSLFIIGNGTATNARSNALTVDESGNVNAAGNVTATGTISAVNSAFTVDSSGNVNANSITVGNHASQIGDRVQLEGGTAWTTNVTSSADAWVQLGSISLTAGRWIIVARARFTPTSSGNHYSSINISTTNKLEAVRDRRYGTGTYYNQHSTSMIIGLSSDVPVYVNGMASVAGTWTRTNNSAFTIDAIRIM